MTVKEMGKQRVNTTDRRINGRSFHDVIRLFLRRLARPCWEWSR